MNNFTSPYDLPYLNDFKRERELKINSLINNLKLNEVKDDQVFLKTQERIKKNILIEPVEIGDPKLNDYEYQEKSLSFEQQLIGGSKNHYIHKILFPIKGNYELISYKPESGFTYHSSDHGLILPYGNTLIVEVDLPELNPDRAIIEANKYLSMTIQFVNSNNTSVKLWNTNIEQRIDELLNQKREELIRIFGNK